jgi:ribosomal protein S27AE
MGDDNDFRLKLKCVDLAAREQFYSKGGLLDPEILFRRAEEIYIFAYSEGIMGWGDGPVKKKKEPWPPKVPVIIKKTKECPNCGEKVPSTWDAHKFKTDGTKCGYVWGEK